MCRENPFNYQPLYFKQVKYWLEISVEFGHRTLERLVIHGPYFLLGDNSSCVRPSNSGLLLNEQKEKQKNS